MSSSTPRKDEDKAESTSGTSRKQLTASETRRRAVTGVANVAVREMGIRAFGLVGSIVVARLLTPRDFGIVAFGYTLIALGSFLADGGIGARLVQRAEAPTMHELRAMLGFVMWVTSATVLVIAAVGLPLGEAGQVATVMALSLPLSCLSNATAVVAEREMLYRPFVISDLLQAVSSAALSIGLVVAGLGVWGLAIAIVVSTSIGTAALFRVGPLGPIRPAFSLATVKPILSFGLQFQAVGLISTVRDQGLNAAAAAVGGLPVLGIWSLVNRVLQAVLLVFNSLWRVSFPAVARLIAAGEDPRPSIERVIQLTTTFTGFCVLAVGATAPALIPVVFGGKWSQVVPVLPWACAGIIVAGPVSTAAMGLFYARGEPQVMLWSVVAHTVTWFAVGIPLLPSLGAQALGIGWFIASLVDAAVLGRALWRLKIRVVSLGAAPILATVPVGVCGWIAARDLSPAPVALVVSLIIAEGLYLLLMVIGRRSVLFDIIRLLRRSIRLSDAAVV